MRHFRLLKTKQVYTTNGNHLMDGLPQRIEYLSQTFSLLQREIPTHVPHLNSLLIGMNIHNTTLKRRNLCR